MVISYKNWTFLYHTASHHTLGAFIPDKNESMSSHCILSMDAESNLPLHGSRVERTQTIQEQELKHIVVALILPDVTQQYKLTSSGHNSLHEHGGNYRVWKNHSSSGLRVNFHLHGVLKMATSRKWEVAVAAEERDREGWVTTWRILVREIQLSVSVCQPSMWLCHRAFSPRHTASVIGSLL